MQLARELSFDAAMLEDLKIATNCGGFAFLGVGRSLPRLRPHRHVELELNIISKGWVTYVVDGGRFRFAQRSLLWLFPDQEHQLVDRSPDAEYYVAVFKPELIRSGELSPRYTALAGTSPGCPTGSMRHTQLQPDAFDLACRMLDSLREEGPDADVLNREAGYGYETDFHYWHDDPDRLNAGLRHLLFHCWRLQQSNDIAARTTRLHPAVLATMAALGDEAHPNDLSRLARRCGMSDAHLSRTFARQVGTTISRYRNALRLRRFWDAYRSASQPTTTAAAYIAGFGSYAQFYKVFAKAYGCGPREAARRDGHDAGDGL